MIYLKSILAGAAAFMLTTITLAVIAIAVMTQLPYVAQRIFLPQHFDIQFGASYYVNFPLWQIIAIGLFAFTITVVWMIRRS